MSSFGCPIKGSKSSIAKWLVDQLPAAETFADIFCGGCSVTHAAMISGKYNRFIINDIDARMPQFFVDCIQGKYTIDTHKEWVSREAIFDNLGDPYIASCWSFGNDGETYLYGREIEPYKKALHHAVFYRDTSLFEKLGMIVPLHKEVGSVGARYFAYKRYFNNRKYDLETVERLQRLENLQELKNIKGIEQHGVDYQEVELPDDAVIYCDIPYSRTNGGRYRDFNHNRFYEWAREQDNIFISEYWMPDDFIPFAHKEKIVLSAANSNSITAQEIIYTNKRTYDRFSNETKERAALNFSEQINLFDVMGV